MLIIIQVIFLSLTYIGMSLQFEIDKIAQYPSLKRMR